MKTQSGLGWVVLAAGFAALLVGVWMAPSLAVSPGHHAPVVSSWLRLLSWGALVLAAFASALTLRGRLGPAAPWCLTVFVFGSATWAMVLWQPLAVFSLTAVALAFCLMLYAPVAGVAAADLPQMYDGGLDDGTEVAPSGGLGRGLRFALAGALLAVPAVWHPAFLGLFIAGFAALPYTTRRRAATALFLGAGLVLAGGVLGLGGGLERWTADLHLPLLDAHLLGWNLAWFFVGRQAGALIYFLPLVVALFADLRDRTSAGVLLGVAVSTILLVVLRPFDWVLGPSVLAGPSFLPLYGALWFLTGRTVRPALLFAIAAPALALLWPLVQSPLSSPLGSDGAARYVTPWIARLPVEVSQRELPGVRDAESGALRIRLLDGAAWTESMGALRLQGDRAADLLVISPDALPAIRVEFGSRASARLTVTGAAAGDTAFHPDGAVGFEILLAQPTFELPMWWSGPSRLSVYRLGLRLNDAPAVPIPFTIKPGGLRRKGA
ncbi:MAG: hypothetical protein ABI609_13385 [Acidobacteriota bacterium]